MPPVIPCGCGACAPGIPAEPLCRPRRRSIPISGRCRCRLIQRRRAAQRRGPAFPVGIADRRYGRRPAGVGIRRDAEVSPRCTGLVDAFTVFDCAGIAAVRAAFGCGARIIAGFAALISGVFSLASISMRLQSRLRLGLGHFDLRLVHLQLELGLWKIRELGRRRGLELGRGGGVVGKISSVCSNCAPE